MVIAAVDQRHLHRRAFQPQRGAQAAEASAQNHHAMRITHSRFDLCLFDSTVAAADSLMLIKFGAIPWRRSRPNQLPSGSPPAAELLLHKALAPLARPYGKFMAPLFD